MEFLQKTSLSLNTKRETFWWIVVGWVPNPKPWKVFQLFFQSLPTNYASRGHQLPSSIIVKELDIIFVEGQTVITAPTLQKTLKFIITQVDDNGSTVQRWRGARWTRASILRQSAGLKKKTKKPKQTKKNNCKCFVHLEVHFAIKLVHKHSIFNNLKETI